jgi:hypothetical protein
MKTIEAKTTMDLVREFGVPYHQIAYAIKIAAIPEPARIGCHRAFVPAEVERIKAYFEAKRRVKCLRRSRKPTNRSGPANG